MQIDAKRVYLPGVLVVAHCPECGEVIVRDLGTDPALHYPRTGTQNITMYHQTGDGMEHEWLVRVDLQVTVTAVEGCAVQVAASPD